MLVPHPAWPFGPTSERREGCLEGPEADLGGSGPNDQPPLRSASFRGSCSLCEAVFVVFRSSPTGFLRLFGFCQAPLASAWLFILRTWPFPRLPLTRGAGSTVGDRLTFSRMAVVGIVGEVFIGGVF